MIKREHVIPKVSHAKADLMVVGMATGFGSEVSSQWLQWVEDFFNEFDEAPQFGCCRVGDLTTPKNLVSRGYFKNIRARATNFLDDTHLTNRSVFVAFDSPPSGGYSDEELGTVVVAINKRGHLSEFDPLAIVSWSVRCPPTTDPVKTLEKIDRLLIQTFAPKYGFTTFWPAGWHWTLTVSGTGYIPRGWDEFHDADNIAYGQRMNRSSSYREWIYRLENGWLREVYSVNLINDRHLAAPFNGATLGDYIANHGTLARNIHGSELHRWHVPDDIIDQVRNDLEHSGLILSSETEPLALPV